VSRGVEEKKGTFWWPKFAAAFARRWATEAQTSRWFAARSNPSPLPLEFTGLPWERSPK